MRIENIVECWLKKSSFYYIELFINAKWDIIKYKIYIIWYNVLYLYIIYVKKSNKNYFLNF